MNKLITVITLGLSLILPTACFLFPGQVAELYPQNEKEINDRMIELERSNTPVRERINELTDTFLGEMTGLADDEEKDEIEQIVKGYLIAVSLVDEDIYPLGCSRIAPYNNVYDAYELATMAESRARNLLDSENHELFKKLLIRWLPRSRRQNNTMLNMGRTQSDTGLEPKLPRLLGEQR